LVIKETTVGNKIIQTKTYIILYAVSHSSQADIVLWVCNRTHSSRQYLGHW